MSHRETMQLINLVKKSFLDNNGAKSRRGVRHIRLWLHRQYMVRVLVYLELTLQFSFLTAESTDLNQERYKCDTGWFPRTFMLRRYRRTWPKSKETHKKSSQCKATKITTGSYQSRKLSITLGTTNISGYQVPAGVVYQASASLVCFLQNFQFWSKLSQRVFQC